MQAGASFECITHLSPAQGKQCLLQYVLDYHQHDGSVEHYNAYAHLLEYCSSVLLFEHQHACSDDHEQ